MGAPRAAVLIRPLPHYRHDAFVAGFRALGYEVTVGTHATDPRPGDVLAIWNRYGIYHRAAEQYERVGAKVLVAENGYLGVDRQGLQYYALALSGHNGSGRWHVGGPERWEALGLRLEPWRPAGRHILVRAQRGIGSAEMQSPMAWHDKMVRRLRAMTDREVHLRQHPATAPDQPSLAEQLVGAHCLVSWASSDIGRAILMGVPAFYEAPHHVLETIAERGLENLETPRRRERLPGFVRLAWAQWNVAEIASGEPFRILLQEVR